ncbi:MAG: hemerythrin domain-containing protein, partial [bacterium]
MDRDQSDCQVRILGEREEKVRGFDDRERDNQMLTSVITNRFLKHHDLCLAYMETLEKIAQSIRTSGNSHDQLEAHQTSLEAFFRFMETVELQHQKEEERVLLPVLASRMNQAKCPLPEAALNERIVEHTQGKKLLSSLKQSWIELTVHKSQEASQYYLFTSHMLDLVWHFRRHIWEENALILPTVRH